MPDKESRVNNNMNMHKGKRFRILETKTFHKFNVFNWIQPYISERTTLAFRPGIEDMMQHSALSPSSIHILMIF